MESTKDFPKTSNKSISESYKNKEFANPIKKQKNFIQKSNKKNSYSLIR